jgi:carbon-monoxide dehydrogenase small subunit
VSDDERIDLTLEVNGEQHTLSTPPLRRLLDLLRGSLRLTGTKEGCGEGECGACTVLVDGRAVNSCLIPVCQLEGTSITTVENTELSAIGQAFLDEGGTQCGICTPGMIVATRAWLDERRAAGEACDVESARVALAGNLCRCTGYSKILLSALAAAREAQA